MAFQRCAVHSGMPPGVLCRAVQQLHRCLSPLLEKGNLLDLEMLDVARKDPMTPAPAERASSLRPRVEEPVGVPTPNELSALEPEEAAQSEDLALVQRRLLAPPGFTLSWVNKSGSSPLEEADWLVSIPLEIPQDAQLDLTSFGSLQVTISHYLEMGEVWYQCQTKVITHTSLQLALPKSSDQPDSSPQTEELWVNTTLFNWPVSDYTTFKTHEQTLNQACICSWNAVELETE